MRKFIMKVLNLFIDELEGLNKKLEVVNKYMDKVNKNNEERVVRKRKERRL